MARVQADGFLEKLLHEYDRLNIPAKWFTASIQEQYMDIQGKRISLENMMQDNIVTVAMASRALIGVLQIGAHRLMS